MRKTLAMALLVSGTFLVVFDGNAKNVTAQTQPTTSASSKEMILGLGNGVTMKLVQIPAGKFIMGSPGTEMGRAVQTRFSTR